MAKQHAKIYYGLHFYPGVAEYRPEEEEAYRIFINESTIRKMGPTFAGKPLFVRHVDEVNLRTLEQEMDGLVIDSFFNKADGKHWTKFAVTTDAGHQAIAAGWKLSNAYHPTSFAPGGVHNGLDFDKEVMDGEYDHLALVDDPRYEESMILTPEQFKEYNAKKEAELHRLTNSKDKNKGEGKMGFSIFKRTKVENSADFENMVVQLPKSKKEFTITELVNAMDVIQNMHGYANDEHLVKVGDDEMSVKKLAKGYSDMMNAQAEAAKAKAENEMDDEDESVDNAGDSDPDEDMENGQDEKKEPELANDDDDMENDQDEKKSPDLADKKKNSLGKKAPTEKEKIANALAEKKVRQDAKRASGNAAKLMNVKETWESEERTVDLPSVQVARGKSRYGSSA